MRGWGSQAGWKPPRCADSWQDTRRTPCYRRSPGVPGVEVSESRPFFEELSPLDAFFLYAERHEAPLHIGAVYIVEGEPELPGGRGAQGIGQTLEERLHLVPRYRQKVRFRPLNLGHPVW